MKLLTLSLVCMLPTYFRCRCCYSYLIFYIYQVYAVAHMTATINHLSIIATEKQCCHSDLFILKSPNYTKSRDSFLFRTQRVVNNLPSDINFDNPVGLKNRLVSLMHQKLKEKFNDDNICSWKICCDCTNCRLPRCI